MKIQKNRIFISDLPEHATKEEIQGVFGEYGEVINVDIKERKEIAQKNTSLLFAYILLNTDSKRLQDCFYDFSHGKWLGRNVSLQLAKESFLDQLKRERENEQCTPKVISNLSTIAVLAQKKKINGISKVTSNYVSSESSSYDKTEDICLTNSQRVTDKIKITSLMTSVEQTSQFISKNNRGSTITSKVLKIDSVGKEPIVIIEKGKNQSKNTSEANMKRLESLKNLKKGYHFQKSLIQTALSNIDSSPKNKIIFDNSLQSNSHKEYPDKNKKFLFEENESEDECTPTFSVKEHFQGEQGQKLLELQARYKNDRRFALDERFLDAADKTIPGVEKRVKNCDKISLEEEKKKEYEILTQVLGKKIIQKEDKQDFNSKTMLRFDPSHPEHSKYEIPQIILDKKEKRKRKNSEIDVISEKKHEEKSAPAVSKEVFFKVSENLKQTFEEKKDFSLLSIFGKYHEESTEKKYESEKDFQTINNSFHKEKNPFKYDSSDEDEIEDRIEIVENNSDHLNNFTRENNTRQNNSWTDPFFFKLDDYRLQGI